MIFTVIASLLYTIVCFYSVTPKRLASIVSLIPAFSKKRVFKIW